MSGSYADDFRDMFQDQRCKPSQDARDLFDKYCQLSSEFESRSGLTRGATKGPNQRGIGVEIAVEQVEKARGRGKRRPTRGGYWLVRPCIHLTSKGRGQLFLSFKIRGARKNQKGIEELLGKAEADKTQALLEAVDQLAGDAGERMMSLETLARAPQFQQRVEAHVRNLLERLADHAAKASQSQETSQSSSFWVELYRPTPTRNLDDIWIWFHEGKPAKEQQVKEGDRVLFYEAEEHPDHKGDPKWAGAKRLFASGTVTADHELIPEEMQLSGGKRWVSKMKVAVDLAVDAKEGVPLEEIRAIRAKGMSRSGFSVTQEEFLNLESALWLRLIDRNAKSIEKPADPTTHPWQPFMPGLPLTIQPQSLASDPAAVAAARERSHNGHIKLANAFAEALKSAGIEPVCNAHCDLKAHVDEVNWIFEVKSCHAGNQLAQVRQGVAQLYEYRFRYSASVPDAMLCLVLQEAPSGENSWLARYLQVDRGIYVTWPTTGGFQRVPGLPPLTRQPW